jgi:hypothetical protein
VSRHRQSRSNRSTFARRRREPDDLKEFGLDRPRVEVEFKSATASRTAVASGEKNATGGNVYAKRNDEKARVPDPGVPRSVVQQVDVSILRDKTLMTFAATRWTASKSPPAPTRWRSRRPATAGS